jgi:hypothetical protein
MCLSCAGQPAPNAIGAEPLLASFAQTNGFKIVGGVYDLATGNIGVLS